MAVGEQVLDQLTPDGSQLVERDLNVPAPRGDLVSVLADDDVVELADWPVGQDLASGLVEPDDRIPLNDFSMWVNEVCLGVMGDRQRTLLVVGLLCYTLPIKQTYRDLCIINMMDCQ